MVSDHVDRNMYLSTAYPGVLYFFGYLVLLADWLDFFLCNWMCTRTALTRLILGEHVRSWCEQKCSIHIFHVMVNWRGVPGLLMSGLQGLFRSRSLLPPTRRQAAWSPTSRLGSRPSLTWDPLPKLTFHMIVGLWFEAGFVLVCWLCVKTRDHYGVWWNPTLRTFHVPPTGKRIVHMNVLFWETL